MNKPNPAPEPTMEEILASIRRIISDGDDDAAAAAVAEDSRASGPAPAPVAESPAADRLVPPRPAPTDVAKAESTSAEQEDDEIFDLTEDMVAADEDAQAPGDAAAQESGDADPDEIDRIMAGDLGDDDGSLEAPGIEPPVSRADGSPEIDLDDTDAAAGDAVTGPAAEPSGPDLAFSRAAMDAAGSDRQTDETTGRKAGPPTGLLSPQTNAAVESAFDQLANTILTQDARTLEDLVKDMLRPMLKEWLDDNLPVLVEKIVREEIERVSRGRR